MKLTYTGIRVRDLKRSEAKNSSPWRAKELVTLYHSFATGRREFKTNNCYRKGRRRSFL
jgi:hypothetical protein